MVIESTLSLNVSSRSVSDNRTCGHGESCWGLAARRVSCLVVLMRSTGQTNPLDCRDGRQFGQENRPGPVAPRLMRRYVILRYRICRGCHQSRSDQAPYVSRVSFQGHLELALGLGATAFAAIRASVKFRRKHDRL